jgi:hypothetical protein
LRCYIHGGADDGFEFPSLRFAEMESAVSLGTLTCDENNVSVLEGNRSQLPVLSIFLITSDARTEAKVMLRYQDGCRT